MPCHDECVLTCPACAPPLQDGVAETGVSLAFTVLRCDSGPVLEQVRVPLHGCETAPQLTAALFALGAQRLLARLPRVLAGLDGPGSCAAQDEAAATYAPKVRSGSRAGRAGGDAGASWLAAALRVSARCVAKRPTWTSACPHWRCTTACAR
jgi:hypothetical protein